jgi:hypothetical protein
MPVIDFTEIPEATSGPRRDEFELFAREFLELIGYRAVTGPDRGADGGRDIILIETRSGVGGESIVKWLVSCKHKAHSGSSVTPADEQDIHDRVRTHGCDGFIAFYSTIPSSGLATKLNAPDLTFEVQIYDPEKIERYLLSSSGIKVAQRFFPNSVSGWKREHPTPAKIFSEDTDLFCKNCGKSLLIPKPHGIVVAWTTIDSKPEHTEFLYWCCKGRCDRVLRKPYRREAFIDGWEDITDLIIPVVYIRWIMATLNKMQSGDTYSMEAFKNNKELLLCLFPRISRHLTQDEDERMNRLQMIPHYLGGLGYED